MNNAKNKIYIGTSGWSYKHWTDGVFYPPDINNRDWLKFYSRHFNTVEINISFYRRIMSSVYGKWRQDTPKDFIFSVKMSRYLTHIKRLDDPEESWMRFMDGAGRLKEKLGPVLFQLPANFKVNTGKLEGLLMAIRANGAIRTAFEFRNEGWFSEEIYSILRKYNACLVFSDSGRWPSSETITADFIYVRMHGPGGLYDSRYADKELKKWAGKINGWKKAVKSIYVYFNNDYAGYAAENARALIGILNVGNA